MFVRSLLALLFAVAISSAQNQPPQPLHRPISSAQIYGFSGPIHTSKGITTELHKDPRSQPKLPIRPSERGWMLFDQSGRLREEGNLDGAGNLQQLVRRAYDANGEQISSEITVGQKVTRYRQQTSTTPEGAVETVNLVDDKLLSKVVSRSDQSGETGETTVKDEEGRTISFTRSQTDGSIQTMQSWGKGGKLVIDMRRTVDDDGNVTETSRFDEAGRLVSTMSFNQGQLTSFWQDPDCKCTNVAGFRNDGSTVFYTTDEAGKLYKEIQHHPGRLTNMEIDDDELYGQGGTLLERIAYAYVRDAHGNWTRRTVSVLDPNTNAMVVVREDTRELNYF